MTRYARWLPNRSSLRRCVVCVHGCRWSKADSSEIATGVPILAALVQEAEEQAVVLRVGAFGLLGQETEAGTPQEVRAPRIDPACRIDENRCVPIDIQRPLPVVDIGPLVQHGQEPSASLKSGAVRVLGRTQARAGGWHTRGPG